MAELPGRHQVCSTVLSPATYDVRIRDAANIVCIITLNPALTITEPAVLNATVSSTNITCNGANDGSITITSPTGGYGTYDYHNQWRNNLAANRKLYKSYARHHIMFRFATELITACVIILESCTCSD